MIKTIRDGSLDGRNQNDIELARLFLCSYPCTSSKRLRHKRASTGSKANNGWINNVNSIFPHLRHVARRESTASEDLIAQGFLRKMRVRSLVPFKGDHSGFEISIFYLHFSRISSRLCFNAFFGKVFRLQLQHNWQLINCVLIKRTTKLEARFASLFALFDLQGRDCLGEHNNNHNGGVSRYNLRIFDRKGNLRFASHKRSERDG